LLVELLACLLDPPITQLGNIDGFGREVGGDNEERRRRGIFFKNLERERLGNNEDILAQLKINIP
jgi:hypothetical protein